MYVFPEMIEIGMKKGEKWPSKAHKTVAMNALLCNPRITSAEIMKRNIEIINKIPKERIKKVTRAELFEMGVQVSN
jgi:hypothetical protein